MVVEHLIPFHLWLQGFLSQAGGAVLLLSLLGLLFGYLRAAITHGPFEGFVSIARVIRTAFGDLLGMSPRRTLAIASLAWKESIRRRVLVAFAVFMVVMLFAGWFLDVKNDHPARLYTSFVLTAANYLVLVLAVFLSALSLPADIKNQTIFTVVTKPVRSGEVVLGRILGFGAIGTVVLLAMYAVSYVFVIRGLDHTHALGDTLDEVVPRESAAGKAEPRNVKVHDLDDPIVVSARSGRKITQQGITTLNAQHRHKVYVDAEGNAFALETAEHTHAITKNSAGEFILGPAEGHLQARVPIYGKLSFLDRAGNPTNKGVNVGQEWNYRSYIEGGTFAKAIWTFEGITREKFNDQFLMEMSLRVFRTYKGDVEAPILGTIVLKNPATSLRSVGRNLHPREFTLDRMAFPAKLTVIDSRGKQYEGDLFDDLVDKENGNRIEVHVQCEERGQYYGMAAPDVYLRAGDRLFAENFAKAYIAIWYQMVIVMSFGVMFSTFLNAPVALLATFTQLALGCFRAYVFSILEGVHKLESDNALEGGGPLEAFVRVLNQQNMTSDLQQNDFNSAIIKNLDWFSTAVLGLFTWILPDYTRISNSDYAAYGFDMNWVLLAENGIYALFFLLSLTGLSYFLLRTREIAA